MGYLLALGLRLTVFRVTGTVGFFKDRTIENCANLVGEFGLTLFKTNLLRVFVVFPVVEGRLCWDILDKLLDGPEASLSRLGLDNEFFEGEGHDGHSFLPVTVTSGLFCSYRNLLKSKVQILFIVSQPSKKQPLSGCWEGLLTKLVDNGGILFSALQGNEGLAEREAAEPILPFQFFPLFLAVKRFE